MRLALVEFTCLWKQYLPTPPQARQRRFPSIFMARVSRCYGLRDVLSWFEGDLVTQLLQTV